MTALALAIAVALIAVSFDRPCERKVGTAEPACVFRAAPPDRVTVPPSHTLDVSLGASPGAVALIDPAPPSLLLESAAPAHTTALPPRNAVLRI